MVKTYLTIVVNVRTTLLYVFLNLEYLSLILNVLISGTKLRVRHGKALNKHLLLFLGGNKIYAVLPSLADSYQKKNHDIS